MVDIILRKDVEDLGKAGEVVDVKPGYARNYLIPQGLALRATEGNVRRFQEERRHEERAEERVRERAEETARALKGRSVTITVNAGEEGRLFGSVGNADIAEALAEDGVRVDRKLIELDEPIKQLGVYRVPVRLHADVQPEVKVWVVARD